jgi:hypothetical protein
MTLAVTTFALMGAIWGAADAGATRLSIKDAKVVEGNSGTTNMKFKVTRTDARRTVTVHYKTVDRTATAPGDYKAKSGNLRFSGGRKARRIKVSVVGDADFEPNETFRVKLSHPTHARIADGRAKGTILKDDPSGCFDDAAAAVEGDNLGDLTSNACPQGAGGDAQSSCDLSGDHQWWSFDVPAGEYASFIATPAGGDDIGLALFTANSDASELDCKDVYGPGQEETAATTNAGVSTMTVYVQVFATPGQEGSYTLNVVSENGCFNDAVAAVAGDNGGDLSSNACARGQGGDAESSCEMNGNQQWWSFDIPAGETGIFGATPAPGDDIGLAVFTANSDASEVDCKDLFGPGEKETAITTNSGATTMTVYVQVFAFPGDEGPYTLNVANSDGCFNDAVTAVEGDNLGNLTSNACVRGAGGDAQSSCEMDGNQQWWSFDIPVGETGTFVATPAGSDDIGVALFTANSNAGEVDCKDLFGPGYAETATATNAGVSTTTVYVQIFAFPGHEGPYTLNVASAP